MTCAVAVEREELRTRPEEEEEARGDVEVLCEFVEQEWERRERRVQLSAE